MRERIAQLESQDQMKEARIEELMTALLQSQQAKLLRDDGTSKASEQQQQAQPPAHAPLLQQQGPATEKVRHSGQRISITQKPNRTITHVVFMLQEVAEALMSVARGAPKPRKAACPAAPSSAPQGPATHLTKKRGAPPKPPNKKPKVAATAPARKRGRTPDTPPTSDTSPASQSQATSDTHSALPRAAGSNE
ncbi:hypothetical protein HaLaN_20431, partial [Haematococcus lacustris]